MAQCGESWANHSFVIYLQVVLSGMPLIFVFKGFRFFFFSNEGHPREPMHIHIRKDAKIAKVWLRPEISIAESYGFTGRELTILLKVVRTRRAEIMEA